MRKKIEIFVDDLDEYVENIKKKEKMKNEFELLQIKKAYSEATELICQMENERVAFKNSINHLIDIIHEKDSEIECLAECLNEVLTQFKDDV